jgi:hypothetical protein
MLTGGIDVVFNLVLSSQANVVVNDHFVRSKPPEIKSNQHK